RAPLENRDCARLPRLPPLARPPVASRYAPRAMPSGTDGNQSPPAPQPSNQSVPAAQLSRGTPPNLPKSVTWFRVQNPRTEKTSAPIMPSANIALLALSARVHKAIVQRQHWGSTMALGTV